MKKIFLAILIGVVAGVSVILAIALNKNSDYVAKSGSTIEYESHWRVALAHYINEQGISIVVDGEEQEKQILDGSYMSDDLELMMSQDALREAFDCAVDFYDGEELHIDRGKYSADVKVNANYMHVNGKTYSLGNKLIVTDKVYVPAEIISKGIGYTFNWDMDNFVFNITNNNPKSPSLPSYYNYAENRRVNFAGNQGNEGTCWAFAAISALESSMLPERLREYSEDHLIYNNGFGFTTDKGGDRTMSMAYFASWKGPVNYEDDPYGDNKTNDSLKAVEHVQEIKIVASKDYENIKKMILKYGAVESSIHFALLNKYTIDDKYYNEDNFSYCYTEEGKANHEIIIIGWDDNYPAENFNSKVNEDGAFICQNSWGSEFGDDGIFYVSYEDTVIGTVNEVYTRIENADNYDNIYQYDLCGWIGQIGFEKNHAFFANVYRAEDNQNLKAVSFYATGPDTTYKIYLDTKVDAKVQGSRNPKISLNTLVAEGDFKEAGYYTVKLDKEYPLSKGKDFAIIVEINTPGASHPIAIEMRTEEIPDANITFEGNRSYISSYGKEWEYTQKKSKCNVCLKAFTDNK